jgi:hypothetical protein
MHNNNNGEGEEEEEEEEEEDNRNGILTIVMNMNTFMCEDSTLNSHFNDYHMGWESQFLPEK